MGGAGTFITRYKVGKRRPKRKNAAEKQTARIARRTPATKDRLAAEASARRAALVAADRAMIDAAESAP